MADCPECGEHLSLSIDDRGTQSGCHGTTAVQTDRDDVNLIGHCGNCHTKVALWARIDADSVRVM